MLANAVIYNTGVLCYCAVLCCAVSIIIGKQDPGGTVTEHSVVASKSFPILGHVREAFGA